MGRGRRLLLYGVCGARRLRAVDAGRRFLLPGADAGKGWQEMRERPVRSGRWVAASGGWERSRWSSWAAEEEISRRLMVE